MASDYASVAIPGRSGKRGGQHRPSRPLRGILGEGWREGAGDGGEFSSVSGRGTSIGLFVQACRLILLPVLRRSKAEASNDAADGEKPAATSACGGRMGRMFWSSLVAGARSSSLAIALFDLSVNSASVRWR